MEKYRARWPNRAKGYAWVEKAFIKTTRNSLISHSIPWHLTVQSIFTLCLFTELAHDFKARQQAAQQNAQQVGAHSDRSGSKSPLQGKFAKIYQY